MPEVVRVASELYEKDREQEAEAEQRQATVDAAAEVGQPGLGEYAEITPSRRRRPWSRHH